MSLERVEFEVWLEEPTIGLYRTDWVPSPGVELAGSWGAAVVTGETGRDYLGLRGWSDHVYGMTHTISPTCGFRELPQGMGDAPHLFPEYANHDWFEPYEVADGPDRVALTYSSGRLERDADGLHWHDADGRWEMHGKTISKVFVVRVPEQEGVAHEVLYRHELLHARGAVSGEPVEGYFHQDFAYGPPGMAYTDLPIARDLYGSWVSWIHEYADGSVGGGCFWQGRGGLDFGPGYLLRDGETTAHDDVVADVTLASGRPSGMKLAIGGEQFDFAFTQTSSPIHYFGRLLRSSEGKDIAKSWCWVEYAEGLLTAEILEMSMAKYRLARSWRRG
jgi:hypothetical protein